MNQHHQKQVEEIEVLSSIYGSDFTHLEKDNKIFQIKIGMDKNEQPIFLVVQMLDKYPSLNPPLYEIKSSYLTQKNLEEIDNLLTLEYQKSIGDSILFSWITVINEYLAKFENIKSDIKQSQSDNNVKKDNYAITPTPTTCEFEEDISQLKPVLLSPLPSHDNYVNNLCLDITTGTTYTEKKSVFQAHLSKVKSLDEVKLFMRQLKDSNKKVAQATHNIMAYRISVERSNPNIIINNSHDPSPPTDHPSDIHANFPEMGTKSKVRSNKKILKPQLLTSSYLQDYDDDGEAHAGHRLLHLLQLVDARDVAICVSRWYGGIKLGPDRFKLINNVARDLLSSCGYVKVGKNIMTKSKGRS